MDNRPDRKELLDRRSFLRSGAMATGALAAGAFAAGPAAAAGSPGAEVAGSTEGARIARQEPTEFVHACMTLPYRFFPLERALTGIKGAGFDHVTWGTTHQEGGESRPVLATDASTSEASELARRCRDMGLEPVKMFSLVYPDHDNAIEVLTNRIRQAEAAGIEQVLTFGAVDGGDPAVWVEVFKELGPIAADHNVTLVMKQHGGWTTGTGQALAWIVREVDHPNVWMSYDAGNVFWYLEVDPIPDIRTCADLIRGFCLKDGRMLPRKASNGIGYGDIDHYRLFEPVAFTGRKIILAYENIFPPYIGNPESPEQVDEWARFAREFMVNVLNGLQRVGPAES